MLNKSIQIPSSATVQKKQCPLNGQCLTEGIVYQVNLPGYKEKSLPWCIRNNS